MGQQDPQQNASGENQQTVEINPSDDARAITDGLYRIAEAINSLGPLAKAILTLAKVHQDAYNADLEAAKVEKPESTYMDGTPIA